MSRSYKIDQNFTFSDRSKIERFALEELFCYMNHKSNDFTYHLSTTSVYSKDINDGILEIRNKLTGNIKAIYIIEAKVRDTHFDELMLEVKKNQALMRMKKTKDKYLKQNFSDKTVGVMYICFTSSATYLYDLTFLSENKMMPSRTSLYANKETVNKEKGKVEKSCYLLPLDLAVKQKYVFTMMDYNLHILEEAQKNIGIAINSIKQTYSLF